ncbi:MAG: redox-active disulfide protein 2 [Thiotrichales bacterium SG8_50]|nr:MAG: redox-active disulfide protein 2 [Thiotrichales bacterium SG8_50]
MKKLVILGPGCPRCEKLADDTRQAAEELNLDFQLYKITDISAISSFGVMTTPALVVDGDVKCVGKLPSLDELKTMLQ